MESNSTPTTASAIAETKVNTAVELPRVTIKYCTQCKWLLRAAYYAQELLSTFSTQIGEVGLIPRTGGVFTVTVIHSLDSSSNTTETLLWDRKTEGGFPETKQLKSLLRNIIDPSRDLGHIDRSLNKAKHSDPDPNPASSPNPDSKRQKTPQQPPSTTSTGGAEDLHGSQASSATTKGDEPAPALSAREAGQQEQQQEDEDQEMKEEQGECEDCA